MCQTPKPHVFALFASVFFLAGCQRLDYEKTFAMEAGDVQMCPVDAPRSEQKVMVTVTSTATPVDVYVVLEKDQEDAVKAIHDYKKPANPLASAAKTTKAELETTVPAKTPYVVILSGAVKSTEVTLKITGR
jgi:hypothetical protein